MMTVGVMGGMGPAATVDFMHRVVEHSSSEWAKTDREHIHWIVDFNPDVPDRSTAITNRSDEPEQELVAMAVRLEQAGADVLVMPCNQAHKWADGIAAAVSIDLLPWLDIAADGVARSETSGRLGLLATAGTVSRGLYRTPLERRGIPLLEPDGETQLIASQSIGALKAGAREEALHLLRESAERLAAAGAERLLLACTDLSAIAGALPAGEAVTSAVPVIDASQIVAEYVVAYARSA